MRSNKKFTAAEIAAMQNPYEARISYYVNKAMSETQGMLYQLPNFAWLLDGLIEEESDIRKDDKPIILNRNTVSKFYATYVKEGCVSIEFVKQVLHDARIVNTNITVGKDVYDFVEAFARNNGLNPNEVMEQAVNEWHKTHSARERHRKQLKGDTEQ